MKELSIEEKAKAYDEALKKAKDMLSYKEVRQEDIEYIFPELAEDEDERIRKELMEQVVYIVPDKNETDNEGNVLPSYQKRIDKYIAWLEKQREHANFRNKIQVGDKVTRNKDGVLVNLSQLNRVAKKKGEQKLYVNDNAKEMFIKALERVEEQNAKGYKLTDCDKNSWWEDFKEYTTSEQILANSAKTCKDEQKPAEWSKEDERIRKSCIYCFEKDLEEVKNDKYGHSEIISDLKEGYREKIDWLKSLRPQNWKPSKEQMNTLEYYMHTLVCNEYKEILFGLYTDLKKLMEE